MNFDRTDYFSDQTFSTCGCNNQAFSLKLQGTAAYMTQLNIYFKTSGQAFKTFGGGFKTFDRASKTSGWAFKTFGRALEVWR